MEEITAHDDASLPKLTFVHMKTETSLSSKCLLDLCVDVFVCCCLGLNRESPELPSSLRFVLTVETKKPTLTFTLMLFEGYEV